MSAEHALYRVNLTFDKFRNNPGARTVKQYLAHPGEHTELLFITFGQFP